MIFLFKILVSGSTTFILPSVLFICFHIFCHCLTPSRSVLFFSRPAFLSFPFYRILLSFLPSFTLLTHVPYSPSTRLWLSPLFSRPWLPFGPHVRRLALFSDSFGPAPLRYLRFIFPVLCPPLFFPFFLSSFSSSV